MLAAHEKDIAASRKGFVLARLDNFIIEKE